MLHVIASIQVKEGKMSQFMEIFKANIPNVLQENGCIEYVPTIDLPSGLPPQELNPNIATIIEKWHSLDDLKAHLSAPHMLDYKEKVKDIVEDMSVKVLEAV
ncbi:MAG: antibiotic biosynthesis monooxygenase [Deltaproteobacteria bacterium]|nr:antibiotic biosynthesis monooxygenase [Deltaproteobacteria bacterium]